MAERVKRVIELMQGDPSRTFTLEKMAESAKRNEIRQRMTRSANQYFLQLNYDSTSVSPETQS